MMAERLEQVYSQLEQIVDAGNRAKETMDRLVEGMAKNPSNAMYNNIKEELSTIISLEERYITLLDQAKALEAQNAQAKAKAVNNGKYAEEWLISGSKNAGRVEAKTPNDSANSSNKGMFDDIELRFRKALEKIILDMERAGKSVYKVEQGMTEGGSPYIGVTEGKDFGGRKIQYFVDEVGNYGKSISSLNRMQIMNNEEYAKAFKFIEQMGFSREDFVRSRSYGNGDYQVMDFQRNNGGVDYKQSLRVDQSGNISALPPKREFQGFGQQVQKDIGDLLKWSIAITAIYGPINAANEAIQNLIENETRLADVSVALNESVADTNQVFNASYDAAQRSGEAVGGVIDAFGQAYRAAGRIDNQFQRYTASLKLLDSSLLLSKVSTLDQAEAIDVLTAALFQASSSGEDTATTFDRATNILDQWVAVSKIANVDVATLATGVAVLGDTAETAGLSIEQLNALIATIAEVSISGGKEAANIAKALVGNYIQPQAISTLNKYGIAVKDITGKNREFLSVMRDIAASNQAGLLSPDALQEISMSLGGGGIRRAADVSRYIQNFSRSEQIAASQGNVAGASAEALSKKLDTVQTSSTKLSNSLQKLAQTLGNEGGLLDVFSTTIKLATTLITLLDKLSSSTGKVAPLLLGTGIASALMRNSGGLAGTLGKAGLSPNAAGLLSGSINPFAYAGAIANYGTVGVNKLGLGDYAATSRLSKATTIPSLAAIAIPAAQNIANKDYEEAGANIAGGIAGSLIGGPVGALIGAAIAEAFVRTTLTYETQFTNFFAGMITPTGSDTTNATTEDLTRDAFKRLGLGNEDIGKLLAKTAQFESKGSFYSGGIGEIFKSKFGGEYSTPEAAVLDYLKKNDTAMYQKIVAAGGASGINIDGTETRLVNRQKELSTPGTLSYLNSLQQQEQEKLRKQLTSGDIKQSDYANRVSSLSAFPVAATKYFAAMEDQIGGVGDAFSSTEDAYTKFLAVLGSGNSEAIDSINSQIASIELLQNTWDTWDPNAKTAKFTVNGVEVLGTKEDLGKAINNSVDALSQYTLGVANQAMVNDIKKTDVYGSYSSPTFTSQSDLNTVIDAATKAQEKFYKSPEGGNLSNEQYDAFIASLDAFTVAMGESTDATVDYYKKVRGVDQKFFEEAFKQKQGSGEIQGASGIGWSSIGATAAQVRTAESQAPEFIKKYLQPLGYKSDVTDAIYSTSDEQTLKAHGDQKVIQYLLQQILDTEKKQLQGVWNLPEGASAWVPLQSILDGYNKNGLQDLVGSTADVNATTKDIPYSQIPGEELTQYGYGSLKDLLSELTSLRKGDNGIQTKQETLHPSLSDYRNRLDDITAGGSVNAASTLVERFFSGLQAMIGDLTGTAGVKGNFDKVAPAGPLKQADNTQQSASTKLDLKFSSTTQLMVDGRILASIVKPYLAADLLKSNEAGGTVTRTYVI